MTGEPTFFELGVEDADRGRTFYEALFGWRFEAAPSGRGYTIETATIPGGIHGGDPGARPYVFFHVDDVVAAAERVRALGGAVDELHGDGGEEEVATFGRFELCRDDQGSPFGLHQPPTARGAWHPGDGPSFFALGVVDAERGRAFYEALFDWRLELAPGGRGFAIATASVPGGIHGGDAGAGPHLFFGVDDLDVALERVRELGGTVDALHVDDGDESDETFGRFKLCRDDQGSPFGLHQPPGGTWNSSTVMPSGTRR